MLDYIFLLFAALIVFPILYLLMQKGKAGKLIVIMAAAGFLIALAGIYVQNQFSFYYAVLGMLGLSFAAAVLIGKRTEDESVADIPDVLGGPADFREEAVTSMDGLSGQDEFELESDSELAANPLPASDTSARHADTGAGESAASAEVEPDEYDADELEIIPNESRLAQEEAAESYDIEELGALREEPMQYADPIDYSEAESEQDLLTQEDELPVVGTQTDAIRASEPENAGEQQPDLMGDDDILDEDLESWLSSRPLPEGETTETSEEVDPEPDPFGLLTDEELMVEDDRDGKQ
ncbi:MULTISPECIES: hypothetical protein [Bhargavaea]|uniref:Uncharacterized protein n=1 Tax=Bhargavaea changchunensis TaxID=2134037 RepID=A0ABW2NFK3_9BACL|nr:hypothetical protein [Bhargavaea sp. CC-171006]